MSNVNCNNVGNVFEKYRLFEYYVHSIITNLTIKWISKFQMLYNWGIKNIQNLSSGHYEVKKKKCFGN